MNCFRSLLDRRLMVFFSAIVTIGGYDRAVSSETDSQGWDVVSELLDTSDGQLDQAEFCREDDAHLMLDDSLRPETPISLEVESDLGVDHLQLQYPPWDAGEPFLMDEDDVQVMWNHALRAEFPASFAIEQNLGFEDPMSRGVLWDVGSHFDVSEIASVDSRWSADTLREDDVQVVSDDVQRIMDGLALRGMIEQDGAYQARSTSDIDWMEHYQVSGGDDEFSSLFSMIDVDHVQDIPGGATSSGSGPDVADLAAAMEVGRKVLDYVGERAESYFDASSMFVADWTPGGDLTKALTGRHPVTGKEESRVWALAGVVGGPYSRVLGFARIGFFSPRRLWWPGDHKIPPRWFTQFGRRGWTPKKVDEVIEKGKKTTVIDKTRLNARKFSSGGYKQHELPRAYQYTEEGTGHYVIRRESDWRLIQISDRTKGKAFKNDKANLSIPAPPDLPVGAKPVGPPKIPWDLIEQLKRHDVPQW